MPPLSSRRTAFPVRRPAPAEIAAYYLSLFRSLEPAAWERTGSASDCPFVACACPWILAGHEHHHRRILAER